MLNNRDDAFMALRVTFDSTHYLVRLIITLSFYTGAGFMLAVLIQNIFFVWQQAGT
jgi:hypothetical protein